MKDIYSIEEVFNIIGEENLKLENDNDKRKHSIQVDGYEVYPRSLRYMTFYQKGIKCACCGKEGAFFKLEAGADNSNRRHFNLYAEDGTLMTKDHIIPKSAGGLDNVGNMQTMCQYCNLEKGNKSEVSKKIVATNIQNNNKEYSFYSINAAVYFILCKNNSSLKNMNLNKMVKRVIEIENKIKNSIANNLNYYGYSWREEDNV